MSTIKDSIKRTDAKRLGKKLAEKLHEVKGLYQIDTWSGVASLLDGATPDHTITSASIYNWKDGKCPLRGRAFYDLTMATLNYLMTTHPSHKKPAPTVQPELVVAKTEPEPATNIEDHLGYTQPKKMKLTDLMPNPPPAPVVQALEVQVGGSHYKDCSIQPLEFIEANSLGFLEGCIVKRLTRHDKATGKGAQDIHKVIHEAQLLLELRYPQEAQA